MDNKIKAKEIKILKQLFKSAPQNQQELIDSLINEAGFLKASMAECKERIEQFGPVEEYSNGTQKCLKENPASKIYNANLKSYQSILAQLIKLLPEEQQDVKDELTTFLTKRK